MSAREALPTAPCAARRDAHHTHGATPRVAGDPLRRLTHATSASAPPRDAYVRDADA